MTSASKRYFNPSTGEYVVADVDGIYDESAVVQHADDFLGDVLADQYAVDISTGATVVVNEQVGGAVRFLTDTDDDDHATLAMALNISLDRPGYFEARVRSITAATLRAVEVGLSDAKSETAGLAFSSPDTPTAVADDAVVFGYNTDEDAHWHCLSVKGGGTPQATELASGHDAAAGTWQTLRLAWDKDANVTFYIDGVRVAQHLVAVTAATLLTPWITLKSLSAAAKTFDVDYIRFAFDRVA